MLLAGCGSIGTDGGGNPSNPPVTAKACGSRNDISSLVPDCPVPFVCFTQACEHHDECYGACLGTRPECDTRFLTDMVSLCNRSIPLRDPRLAPCLSAAFIYWAAVRQGGGDFYFCDRNPDETPTTPGACCLHEPSLICTDVDGPNLCPTNAVFIPTFTCAGVTETFGGCPRPANDDCGSGLRICADQQPDAGLGRCAPPTDTDASDDVGGAGSADDDTVGATDPAGVSNEGGALDSGNDASAGDSDGTSSSADGSTNNTGSNTNDGATSTNADNPADELPGPICTVSAQDCPQGRPCLPFDGDAYRCTVWTDNRLASTDGPRTGFDCAFSLDGQFVADVWYEYVVPCSGTLTIRMCDQTFYDTLLGVYGTSEPNGVCSCDGLENSLIACDDDACGGFGTASAVTIPNVTGGACYLIRVGGWAFPDTEVGAGRGPGTLDIGVACDVGADQ